MPVSQLSPIATRRPGHAVMARLLAELDGRDLDAVPLDLESWSVGAWGEILAGQELARLPEGWSVLHSIPVGRIADIDHLVVGPGGAFVITTKRHPGKRIRVGTHTVWIDGAQVGGYQQDLLARCADVRRRLGVLTDGIDPVQPLLVFVDAREVRGSGPQPVPGVALDDLVDHLLGQPEVLDPEAVLRLAATASLPETWGRSRRSLLEPDPTARFTMLGRALPERARHATRPQADDPEERRPRLLFRLLLAGVVLPVTTFLVASWALAQALQSTTS